ncbi:MAG: hypothetical protein ACK5M7_07610 [Draconibacterium sp.]
MDSETTIIGLVLIAIVVIPLYMLSRKRARKGQGMLKLMTQTANEHNCKITEYEQCGNYTVGMDKTNGYVFFVKDLNDNADVQYMNLAQVKSCKMDNKSRIVTYNKQSSKIIERLCLNFLPKGKDKPAVVWEFYNAEENSQLNGELQSAEKWQNLINSCLKD